MQPEMKMVFVLLMTVTVFVDVVVTSLVFPGGMIEPRTPLIKAIRAVSPNFIPFCSTSVADMTEGWITS